MALVDIFSDTGTISVVLEFAALVGIVLGFFRWYDTKYRILVKDTKDEVLDKIGSSTDRLCDKIEDIKGSHNKLEESYYDHLMRHGALWISDRKKDKGRESFDAEILRDQHEEDRQEQEVVREEQEQNRQEQEVIREEQEGERRESEAEREERRKVETKREKRLGNSSISEN